MKKTNASIVPLLNCCITIFFLCYFFISSTSVFAVSVDLSNVPSPITTDDFSVNISVTGASGNTSNYLRAAFFQGSSTNYFGYTYNGSSWYNGLPSPIDPKQFLQIPIDPGGSWSGQLKIKIDTGSSAFKGSGNYSIKIGRYTASAESISDWSNIASISVVAPSPTPTPQPPSKSSQYIVPTNGSQDTITSVSGDSGSNSLSSSGQADTNPNASDDSDDIHSDVSVPSDLESGSNSADVLSAATDSSLIESNNLDTPTPEKSQTPEFLAAKGFNWSIFFVASGILVLTAACGILGFRYWKYRSETTN